MDEDNERIIIDDEAWKFYPGPILVLAGPGTGKTFQLAKRIKFLTEEKMVSPDEITVITFTNEAAKSMRKKISDPEGNEYIEPDKRPGRISTMHSLGNRIIKENCTILGLKEDFRIITSTILRDLIMRDAALLVGKTESDAKKVLLTKSKSETIPQNLTNILNKYEEILRKNNYIDYDDQIMLACKLLKENENLRKKYSKSATHLLIDEYQDINESQFEFIKLLSSENKAGLFVVGDDDQSIYSFRGGSPKYIKNFLNDFGNKSKVIKMKTSWRCPEIIINCADTFIQKFNIGRMEKPKLECKKQGIGKVIVHNCPSDDKEAYIIAKLIRNYIPNKSVYILIPNRLYLEKIKKALRNFGVNFNAPFYSEKSGAEILNIIKEWLENPNDNFVSRLFVDILIEANAVQIPSSRAKKTENQKLRMEGLYLLAKLWEKVMGENISYFTALNEEAKRNSLLRDLSKKMREISQLKDEQLPEFLQIITQNTRPWTKTSAFLQEIKDLLDEVKYQSLNTDEYEVRILTMQGAKGLQADIICINGLEETNFPKGTENNEELAEKARLFFVSITRAKEDLHLFCSRKRSGSTTFQKPSFNLKPSRFVTCLPDGIVKYRSYFSRKRKVK